MAVSTKRARLLTATSINSSIIITEIVDYFHSVSYRVEVFLDSFDEPWIEGAYMVPILTYCDVENGDSCIV
jgi:hypothetical protein